MKYLEYIVTKGSRDDYTLLVKDNTINSVEVIAVLVVFL